MQDSAFARFYDTRFLPLDRYFAIHRTRFLESWRFLEAAGRTRPRHVLDLGGIGPLAAFLRETTGCAASETKSDLRNPLDLPDASFELILCTETIEHIKDRDSDRIADLEAFNFSGIDMMLGECHRICRPDGALFVTTPNANSYITLHKWLTGGALLMDPRHVREFSAAELRACGQKAGFVTERLESLDTWRDHLGQQVTPLAERVAALLPPSEVPRGDNLFALFARTG
jgi:SAM-dependent methyltransferase